MPLSLQMLDRLNGGGEALVPAFWSVEVLNSVLVGESRGRIAPEQTQGFLRALAALQPTVDQVSLEQVFSAVQSLSRDHGLTACDALYVELACRTQCPLATLDDFEKSAARTLKIECL
jgi:predicted nucleic acid-binding protein